MFNSTLRQFTLRELADGKGLFVAPKTPDQLIREAFRAEPGLHFVFMQLPEGEIAAIRNFNLAPVYLTPVQDSPKAGKLPQITNIEWLMADELHRTVVTTKPVEDVSAMLDQFEAFLKTIDQTTVEELVIASVKYTQTVEAGKSMLKSFASPVAEREFNSFRSRETVNA